MSDHQQMTEEEIALERKVVRKVDAILLPIMLVSYGLQYYDKSVLGTAAVYGIIKDLVSSNGNTVDSMALTSKLAGSPNDRQRCGIYH